MNDVQKLKQVVSTIENSESIKSYFEFVHDIYSELGLKKDTGNIVQTIRTDQYMRLTVNLNARLFLGLTNEDGEDTLLATMFEKDAEKIEPEVANFRKDNSKFTQIGDEEPSYIVILSMETYQKHQADIQEWVLRCAKDYLPRQEKSNLRRFHSPLLTELTFNNNAFERLLEHPEEYYFSQLIEKYKELVREDQNRPELYKWRNVNHYQAEFDIDADDFHASLKSALSKAQNLVYQLSLSFIKKAAQYYPEEVREMFWELYDEEKDLQDRVDNFNQQADELAPKVSEAHGKELNAYQDERTISYYLAMRYPEKYPIYKDDIYQYLLEVVTEENSKRAGDKYLHYIEVGNRLLPFITNDNELKQLVQSTLDDDCFQGDPKWLVFQDILWRTKYPPEEESDKLEIKQHNKATTYLQNFAKVAEEHFEGKDWLQERYTFFQKFFQKEHLKNAKWSDFQEIPENTHAYTSLNIAGKNAFGDQNHDIERYRKSFLYLAYGEDDLAIRINTLLDKQSEYHLKYIGESFYAEVIGYIYPEKYVFYNTRDKEAISFLDLDIERKSKEQFGDFFIRYNQEIEPLKSLYKDIVGQRTETTIPLELDQFFSWVYENYVKKGSGEIQPNGNGEKGNYWWLNANPDIWRFAEKEVGQEQTYTSRNSRGNKRQIYKNFEQVQPGDLVIGYESTPVKKVKAILEITEPLHTDDEEVEKFSFKLNQFTPNQPTWEELKSHESLADCSVLKNNQGSLFQLTASEFETIYDLAFKDVTAYPTYSRDEALDELFLPEEELVRILNLLEYKKNIILQGPPGTGKTFLAKRLAWLQLGAKDESRISTIQFHPSYSYEDFIRGYRPTEDHFELKDGLFLDICKQAKSDPENPYYLIIDEINRGNLSKIFGELMMLIEKDKRGPEFKVTLPYTKQDESDFYIPENLYLIGTMNTADRSLALVDYALRRRFVFIDLMPNFGEKFQRHLRSFGVDDGTIDLIVERLRTLNTEIARESGLGKGFQIGHSYFCRPNGNDTQWYRNIIEYEIIPLLNEYWFDKPEKVKSLQDELLSI
ncbi:MAG: EVE domain-containing protein [Candidatus Marinimicrobia bacterium]|nr:EVE domain-containing protein [Candidatus Neomarinimicrobiota bacterium]MCF7880184.1 EVE domain-containing protein [Candidatus Neomarinimicrobiota bacterium]